MTDSLALNKSTKLKRKKKSMEIIWDANNFLKSRIYLLKLSKVSHIAEGRFSDF